MCTFSSVGPGACAAGKGTKQKAGATSGGKRDKEKREHNGSGASGTAPRQPQPPAAAVGGGIVEGARQGMAAGGCMSRINIVYHWMITLRRCCHTRVAQWSQLVENTLLSLLQSTANTGYCPVTTNAQTGSYAIILRRLPTLRDSRREQLHQKLRKRPSSYRHDPNE